MIRLLILHGADPYDDNYYGLTMLHVSAQNEAVASMYLYYELGLDINQTDRRGSTPLHWACHSNSEVALTYLLAWNPDLDKQDLDGLTPLHLAIKECDNI